MLITFIVSSFFTYLQRSWYLNNNLRNKFLGIASIYLLFWPKLYTHIHICMYMLCIHTVHVYMQHIHVRCNVMNMSGEVTSHCHAEGDLSVRDDGKRHEYLVPFISAIGVYNRIIERRSSADLFCGLLNNDVLMNVRPPLFLTLWTEPGSRKTRRKFVFFCVRWMIPGGNRRSCRSSREFAICCYLNRSRCRYDNLTALLSVFTYRM